MDNKILNEILATAKRMEKAGTLEKMFENTRELTGDEELLYNPPMISEHYGYKELNDLCMLTCMRLVTDADACMAKAKRYSVWVKELYDDYKSREKDIKQPEILKFIKDYEKDNFGGEV